MDRYNKAKENYYENRCGGTCVGVVLGFFSCVYLSFYFSSHDQWLGILVSLSFPFLFGYFGGLIAKWGYKRELGCIKKLEQLEQRGEYIELADQYLRDEGVDV